MTQGSNGRLGKGEYDFLWVVWHIWMAILRSDDQLL